jgi:hypothetical protein
MINCGWRPATAQEGELMVEVWLLPEGVRVLPDGTWCVGTLPIRHDRGLPYLKSKLIFEADGAYLEDQGRRLPVRVEGPAFEVRSLRIDHAQGAAFVSLDDGSEERLADDSLELNDDTGRFECRVRDGRAKAILNRSAHATLLENADEDARGFFLRVGERRVRLAN